MQLVDISRTLECLTVASLAVGRAAPERPTHLPHARRASHAVPEIQTYVVANHALVAC